MILTLTLRISTNEFFEAIVLLGRNFTLAFCFGYFIVCVSESKLIYIPEAPYMFKILIIEIIGMVLSIVIENYLQHSIIISSYYKFLTKNYFINIFILGVHYLMQNVSFANSLLSKRCS